MALLVQQNKMLIKRLTEQTKKLSAEIGAALAPIKAKLDKAGLTMKEHSPSP